MLQLVQQLVEGKMVNENLQQLIESNDCLIQAVNEYIAETVSSQQLDELIALSRKVAFFASASAAVPIQKRSQIMAK